jgi:Protein of unknown function (DUF1496)
MFESRKVFAMIRRHATPLLFGCAMTLLAAGSAHAASPACLYQSRSYSEGAYICVQKSLMQTCTSDGTRMVWQTVIDPALGDRCVAPMYSAEPRKRIVRRAHVVHRVVAPAEPAPAPTRCFVFNGRRYCE